ncbi:MAG: hypothetical protein M1550_06160 [Deltaproteobacteria bacterium]|nr:hypothetical protein [Deltaproteobacteria bacterium]
MRRTAAFLVLFAAAMAFVEAAVVVYLRRVLGEVEIFPMKDLPPPLLAIEIAREAATIAMLLAVSLLSVRGGIRRMGAFLLTFAAWDVFYYLWLYVVIGWPAGIGEWDILFLIPAPWVGPVWSVLLLCAGMIAFAALFLRAPEKAPFSPGRWGWATGVAGLVAIVGSYVREWVKIGYGKGVPVDFSVLPFLAGLALLGVSGWLTYRRIVWIPAGAGRDRLTV